MSAGALALSLALTLVVAPGRVQRFNVRAASLTGSRTVRVYLPPSYDRPESARRRYPVVLLLHGWPGSDGNWFGLGRVNASADTLIALGKLPELILVCPNGNCGLFGRSVYANNWDGRCRMEDYIAHDVVGWVDSTFRTIRSPSARAVLGLSDGGTGALNLAFRHPDVFGACASHSANLLLRRGEFGLGEVSGPEPGASRMLASYSPQLEAGPIAARLRSQVIYLDCGLGDESIEQNRRFHRTLDSLAVPHVYHEFPGSHTWGYWREHVKQALIAITARMR